MRGKIAKRCNIISVKNTEIRDMIEFKRKIYNKLVSGKKAVTVRALYLLRAHAE